MKSTSYLSQTCYLSFQPFRIPLFCATSKSIRTKLLKQLAGTHLQHVANSGAHARECSGFVYPTQPTAACMWMLQLTQKGMASRQLAGSHMQHAANSGAYARLLANHGRHVCKACSSAEGCKHKPCTCILLLCPNTAAHYVGGRRQLVQE